MPALNHVCGVGLVILLSGMIGCSSLEGDPSADLPNQFLEVRETAKVAQMTADSLPKQLNEMQQLTETTTKDMDDMKPQGRPFQKVPSHLMTNAFKATGSIWMELKHGSPLEQHWSEANRDAHGKCEEWGYKEVEVTGTRHYEVLELSTRHYECRGTVVLPPAETTAKQDAEVKAWNDALMRGEIPAGIDGTDLKVLDRDEDNFSIYFNPPSRRSMPNKKVRLVSVALSPVTERSEDAMVVMYVEYDCKDEAIRMLNTSVYGIDGEYLYGEGQPSE